MTNVCHCFRIRLHAHHGFWNIVRPSLLFGVATEGMRGQWQDFCSDTFNGFCCPSQAKDPCHVMPRLPNCQQDPAPMNAVLAAFALAAKWSCALGLLQSALQHSCALDLWGFNAAAGSNYDFGRWVAHAFMGAFIQLGGLPRSALSRPRPLSCPLCSELVHDLVRYR